MPIYEYQCMACGHQMEAFQKITDEPLKECPVCHKPELNKLISAAGFQLKGSGWYVTDYSNKGKAKEGESGTKSGTETGGGTDTKPAASTPKDSSNSSSKAE